MTATINTTETIRDAGREYFGYPAPVITQSYGRNVLRLIENGVDIFSDRSALFERIIDLIGNTPLSTLPYLEGKILLKDETANPTENHYDRVFTKTIQLLESDGVIEPDDRLIEITSGSGGRAFAWSAALFGYNADIYIPPELPAARTQDMINYGARLIVTDPGYMKAASDAYTKEIIRLRKEGLKFKKHETSDYTVYTAIRDGERVCFLNHSANPITVNMFETIGTEIFNSASPDFVVSVMGNGTSTTALGKVAHAHGSKVIGVEDKRSPYYYSKKYPELGITESDFSPHDMYGSSARGVKLAFGNAAEHVDAVMLVNPDDRDKQQAQYNLGLPLSKQVGKSSAAGLVIARRIIDTHPDAIVATLLYDRLDQYGDTPRNYI
jgi:cysteine synthase